MMKVRPTQDNPALDLLSLADAKAYLRVDHSSDDNLIEDLVQVAVDHVVATANTRWKSTTAYGYLEGFFYSRFPVGPVTAVTAVEYIAQGGTTYTTLPTGKYYYSIQGGQAWIQFHNYPALKTEAAERVRISFTYGYDGSIYQRPTQLKQAAKMMVAHLYDNRLPVVVGPRMNTMPFHVEALTSTFRYL
jgi:uncharacterized phiE125 gp8 family phage protein